jgi:hypothetical protein
LRRRPLWGRASAASDSGPALSDRVPPTPIATVTAAAASARSTEYVHVAVDACSRLAYAEPLADEKAPTIAGFHSRAVAFFAGQGIACKRLMADSGPGVYTSLPLDLVTWRRRPLQDRPPDATVPGSRHGPLLLTERRVLVGRYRSLPEERSDQRRRSRDVRTHRRPEQHMGSGALTDVTSASSRRNGCGYTTTTLTCRGLERRHSTR